MVENSGRAANEHGDGVSWLRGSMIGRGGFGCVYLATPKSKYSFFPSLMAVKSAEVSISGSIQKERVILSNVKGCPYVIRCLGEETTMGDNGSMVYNLLLEYCSGGTLAGMIKKSGGLPESEVKVIARSILRGLSHIHGNGYVHCDLKPTNILFSGGHRAKISDLGLAKRAKQVKKRKFNSYWCGTPMYLSPEAVMDNEQEFPSDIWALGCIVLEMLTGKPPWSGQKNEVLGRIGSGGELPKIPTGVSEESRDFLKGCFVRRPILRSTADMLLNHPFVEGLECDDDEIIEDLNEIESIVLVLESSDDEFGCFGSCCYCDVDYEEEESRDSKVVVDEGATMGPRVDFEFDRSDRKRRKLSGK